MRTQQHFPGEQVPTMDPPRNAYDPLLPGTEILGGRYVVERMLGQGGMGVVVAARHKAMGRRDAIKFLLPQLVTHEEIVRRFEREARAVARLESPHVARVYDSQFAGTSEPYIVMEYLEGRDLKSVLRGGPLLLEDAVDYILQVCHALADAHDNGIVHRDLKPANLFLATLKNGSQMLKVLDFGIAKDLEADPVTDITVEDGKGGFLGTIPYMSPEHLRGARSVDKRTDIWALGVIAYELVTSKKPFNGLTKLDLMSKILDKDEHPDPPSKYRRELPLAIEIVIGRCLAKNREARYQSVREFETALRTAAGIPAPPPMRPRMASITGESPIELQELADAKTRELTQGKTHIGLTVTNPLPSKRPGRSKVVLAGAGAIATSAAVAGLVVALRGGDGATSVAEAHTGVGKAVAARAGVMVPIEPGVTTAASEEPDAIADGKLNAAERRRMNTPIDAAPMHAVPRTAPENSKEALPRQSSTAEVNAATQTKYVPKAKPNSTASGNALWKPPSRPF